MSDKQRIIDLQKQLRIARTALQKICSSVGSMSEAHHVAETALEEMRPRDKPVPLDGLLNWNLRP